MLKQSWFSTMDSEISRSANITEIDETQLKQPFKERFTRLVDDQLKLKIAIMGQAKAGKSSFLNALLFDGRPVLPIIATPKTANLTCISYGGTYALEVEYYTLEEWQDLVKLAESEGEYDTAKVARELMKMAKASQIDPLPILQKGTERIEAKNADELMSLFNQYAGTEGQYSALVKMTRLYLPIEELKSFDFIDTPSMNDPVLSRTQKTREEMARCDVVFFLSRCGQFLDQSDMDLLGNQLPHSGVKRMFLVAGQYDSAILDDGFNRNSLAETEANINTRLTRRAETEMNKLADQRAQAGRDENAELLRSLTNPVLSSTFAYGFAEWEPTQWSYEMLHVHQELTELAEAEWDGYQFTQEDWHRIGNFGALRVAYTQAKAEKQKIIQEQLDAILPEAPQVLQERLVDRMKTTILNSLLKFATQLDDNIPHIEDGVLTARIVGEFSAGKTRVIREILGGQIPEQFRPISSQETQTRLQLEISYGTTSELLLIEKSNDTDSATVLQRLDHFPNREQVAQYDPQTHRLRLLINDSHFILPKGDGYYDGDEPKKLFLIDTPGWNSGQDEIAEQDAHQYTIGEHNLAIIYVCHANRVDGVTNSKRLENFLEALADALSLFHSGQARLFVIVTHCEPKNKQLFIDRLDSRIRKQWAELESEPEPDQLDLHITALDFELMSEADKSAFRQQFWQYLLDPMGIEQGFHPQLSYDQQILRWSADWNIRPLLRNHIALFNDLEQILKRAYVDQQWIAGMNMTRLIGLSSHDMIEKVSDRWYKQLGVSDLQQLMQKFDADLLQGLVQQHPLSAWWQDYWLAQFNTLFTDACQFFQAMDMAIRQVDDHVNDLQVFLTQHGLSAYQKAIHPQKYGSFSILIKTIAQYEAQDVSHDKLIATLLSLSVLQNNSEGHIATAASLLKI